MAIISPAFSVIANPFSIGCLLLYDLHCEAEFSQYADRYGTLIEQAYGLDEKDLADMKKTLSAGP